MERLYYNNLALTVDEFKAKMRMEVKYWYTSRRTCIYMYYFYEDFVV